MWQDLFAESLGNRTDVPTKLLPPKPTLLGGGLKDIKVLESAYIGVAFQRNNIAYKDEKAGRDSAAAILGSATLYKYYYWYVRIAYASQPISVVRVACRR